MTLREILATAITQNELGSRLDLAFKFSDPDGVRTGKSGWSFGRVQYDLANNSSAAACLRECGFTADEISGLIAQTHGPAEMTRLNAKLKNAADVVDDWDRRQLDEMIRHTRQVVANAGLTLADDETFVHLADYHNQFYINFGGKAVAWLQRLGRRITAEDVRAYKLTTLWGQKRPDDVHRRWLNIHRICERAALAGI